MVEPTDLLAYRIRKGMTLRQFSKLTGLSPATLMRLEKGTHHPTTRSRVLLQDRLGLTDAQVEELISQARAQHAMRAS